MELQQKDQALVELLQEKVGLFAEMTHFQVDEDGGGLTLPTLPRGLFRSESLECPRGERLLQDAIREGEGALRGSPAPSLGLDRGTAPLSLNSLWHPVWGRLGRRLVLRTFVLPFQCPSVTFALCRVE